MKKLLLLLVWLVVFVGNAFATDASTPDTAVIEKENLNYRARSGFFFSLGLTFAYSYVRYSYSYPEYSENQYFKGALVPYAEARIGLMSDKLMSLYLMMGLGYGVGNFEYDESVSKADEQDTFEYTSREGNFRFLYGIGTEFYLVQNVENLLYGVFLGASLGYVYDKVSKREFYSLFARFEAGKDWWLRNGLRYGVAVNYLIGSFPDDFDSSKDEHRAYGCHTFGLTVRVAY